MKYQTNSVFNAFGSRFYCGVYLAVFARYSNTWMMSLMISDVDYKFYWDRTLYCCTPSTFAWDTLEIMCPPVLMQEVYCEKYIPQFSRCHIDVQWRNFSEPNICRIPEVRSFIVRDDELRVIGYFGGKPHGHLSKERHYTLIALCAVLGRVAVILLYILLDWY